MLRSIAAAIAVLSAAAFAAAQPANPEGVLLLAHGGGPEWNQRVNALAAALDSRQPVEIAFGMASRAAMQSAVDKLVARGVKSIVAVPLFISSHSSVMTSTAYLLGVREDMPPDLRIFAKMNHGAHGAPAQPGHDDHASQNATADNMRPVRAPVPIRLTDALNRHGLVGDILIDRAQAISSAPENEAVVVVAHGPVPDEDNRRWLDDMAVLARQMDDATSFAAIEYLTVRDDAPKPARDAATEEFRQVVTQQINLGRRVLIVPLLVSFSGIEKGIRQRLEGLDYVMAEQALMPDHRLLQWVEQSIQK